jgi:oligoribonuclease
MLVWMDLEMTGLDPATDVIVEIATLVTDDELTIVAEGPDLVVHQPPEVMARMGDFVREMHTRSGLLDAIEKSDISLADAGAQTLAFIKEQVPEARSVPLCGNSIGTDRRFLALHLPEAAPRKQTAHRALDDISESIRELQFYREILFRPPSDVTPPTPATPSVNGTEAPEPAAPAPAPPETG